MPTPTSSSSSSAMSSQNSRKKPSLDKLKESVKRSFKKNRQEYDIQEEEHQRYLAEHAGDRIIPSPPKTNVLVWCCVIGCSIFAILVILGGLAVLIGYLAFHPQIPKFNVVTASLNTILLDMNFVLSSDTTLYIKAHNPNDKVFITYEYIKFELKFEKKPISTIYVDGFMQLPKNTTGFLLDMNTVALQLEAREGEDLSNSIQKTKVYYDLQGTMKVKSKFGSIASIKYWMYTTCHLTFSPPPTGNGTLLTHDCNSRR